MDINTVVYLLQLHLFISNAFALVFPTRYTPPQTDTPLLVACGRSAIALYESLLLKNASSLRFSKISCIDAYGYKRLLLARPCASAVRSLENRRPCIAAPPPGRTPTGLITKVRHFVTVLCAYAKALDLL